MCIMRVMHRHEPSTTFLRFLDDAGGIEAASAASGISAPQLYCMRNGWRRITERSARRIEEATAGRYRAADLLGLNPKS